MTEEDEKSLVKSEDEKSLDKKNLLRDFLAAWGALDFDAQTEKAFLCFCSGVGLWFLPSMTDDFFTKVSFDNSHPFGVGSFINWLPIWVKCSFALYFFVAMLVIVFSSIINNIKNKLAVWWLFFYAPEGIACLCGALLSFKYVLYCWYRY